MDIESQLGTEFDQAGDTLSAMVDDVTPEVAEQLEGQNVAESQTDDHEGEELDLSAPQFAYTDESGQEIQLTGQQIIELLQGQKQAPVEETKPEEAPKAEEVKPEELADDLPYQVTPIDYHKVGPDLVSMLSGENGGEEALGPAMAEFQFQTFIQDPRFAHVLQKTVDVILQQKEQTAKKTDTFKQFVGAQGQEAEIKAFQKANPWAESREMALLGMQLAATKAEMEKLKSGNTEAIKKAQLEGEKQTIRNLKAKGTLRAIGSKGHQTPRQGDDLKAKYDITDPDQRSRAMAEHIQRMRSKG